MRVEDGRGRTKEEEEAGGGRGRREEEGGVRGGRKRRQKQNGGSEWKHTHDHQHERVIGAA